MKNILIILMLTILGTVCFCFETTIWCLIWMLVDYTLLGINIEAYINRKDKNNV